MGRCGSASLRLLVEVAGEGNGEIKFFRRARRMFLSRNRADLAHRNGQVRFCLPSRMPPSMGTPTGVGARDLTFWRSVATLRGGDSRWMCPRDPGSGRDVSVRASSIFKFALFNHDGKILGEISSFGGPRCTIVFEHYLINVSR